MPKAHVPVSAHPIRCCATGRCTDECGDFSDRVTLSLRQAQINGGCRERSFQRLTANSCAHYSGRRDSLVAWQGLQQLQALEVLTQCRADNVGKALQKYGTHLRVKTFGIITGNDEQSD